MNGNQNMTKKTIDIYKTYDVVVVPFPFADTIRTKNRPAVILSSYDFFNNHIEHSILAMITSAHHNPWPLDVVIKNFKSCGLEKLSLVRLKLFALDHRLILKKIGQLSLTDQKSLRKNFILAFNEIITNG